MIHTTLAAGRVQHQRGNTYLTVTEQQLRAEDYSREMAIKSPYRRCPCSADQVIIFKHRKGRGSRGEAEGGWADGGEFELVE